jgi:hypothetical protein
MYDVRSRSKHYILYNCSKDPADASAPRARVMENVG